MTKISQKYKMKLLLEIVLIFDRGVIKLNDFEIINFLDDTYKYLSDINIKKIDFNLYHIEIKINEILIDFNYRYDNYLKAKENLKKIENQIDMFLLEEIKK